MKKYVDAEELLKHKRKMRGFDLCEEFWDEAVLCEDIKNAPAADVVEVRRGLWEIVKGSNGQEKMVCTNCRHQQDLHSTFTYCPNCGAKIDATKINT